MPQDTFTIRLLAKELASSLRGGRINRINQPGKEELSLLIYTQKGTLKLTVNANAADCGVYFTTDNPPNPLTAPNFCMLLRKYLQGAEVLGVETPGFERILIFRVRCFSDFSTAERELRVEIMGKYSNILLTEKGVILGALKTTTIDENCRRAILPGAPYLPPAPQDKTDPSDLSALRTLLSPPLPDDLPRFLFQHVAGLAPCTAEQIVSGYRGGDFARYVHDTVLSDEIAPCVVEKNGVPTDFFARSVPGGIPFESISAAEQYFYAGRRAKKGFDELQRKLSSAVSSAKKKQEKRLSQVLEKRRQCEGMEEDRIKGELLTANLYRLKQGMRSCELENYYDEAGGTVKIALDERLSPADNAQAYFKRYRKQKRTLEVLGPQETEVRSELEYSLSLLAAIASADRMDDLKCLEEELQLAGLLKQPERRKQRQAVPEYPFRRFEKDGFEVLAGRNNLQNDRLIRTSSPDDIWLHAQKYHSSHVIIRTGGRAVPDEVLLFAAGICARYSDARQGGRIPVDYCPIRQVKKPPKARAGFAIYHEYKTILTEPDTEAKEL